MQNVQFNLWNILQQMHEDFIVGETGNTLYQRHLLNLSRIRIGRNTDTLNERTLQGKHTRSRQF